MKKVVISGHCIQGEWILLNNMDELYEYAMSLRHKVISYTQRLLKSGAPVSRWDHMITQTEEGAILKAVVNKTSALGGRPIVEMGSLLTQKIQSMMNHIKNNQPVLVNEVGGYCVLHDSWEIISEKEFFPLSVKTYVINENTKYINIENDEILEKVAEKYLLSIDKNFSYILNLHSFTKNELLDVFNQFKDNGGQALYVYTSGINIPQMYEYIDAAAKAQINIIEIEFNSDITEKINILMEECKAKYKNVNFSFRY